MLTSAPHPFMVHRWSILVLASLKSDSLYTRKTLSSVKSSISVSQSTRWTPGPKSSCEWSEISSSSSVSYSTSSIVQSGLKNINIELRNFYIKYLKENLKHFDPYIFLLSNLFYLFACLKMWMPIEEFSPIYHKTELIDYYSLSNIIT